MKLDATSTPTEVSRSLGGDNIVPGEGWGMYSDTSSKGDLCDGSPMSECHRSHESCLMYGNNDLHSGIAGDGLSGWLVINIPPIKSGIIWAKMEWWVPRNNWYLTEPKDGDRNRMLGNAIPYPDDVKFEIAVNGKIVKTWLHDEFMSHAYPEMAYNQGMYPLVTDESLTGPVELGLRITSESNPRGAGLSVTHIYYA